jgi:NPCBM/NEW2 domain-containing protein
VGRVVAALAASTALVLAASADAATVHITASAAPWVVLGAAVGVKGTVTPHPAGVELTLQKRKGTGWLPVGTANVRPNGSFSFAAHPERVGRASYRVVTTKGTAFAGSSASIRVRVLQWRYLTSIESFAYITPLSGNLTTTAINSDGVRYEHPVALDPGCYNQWNGSAWIDYLLERQYELFTATVGLDDASPSNETATYTLIGAGKKLAAGSLTPGMSTTLRIPVGDVYRLRLEINVPDPNNAGGCSSYFPHVVFGDAQLLGP